MNYAGQFCITLCGIDQGFWSIKLIQKIDHPNRTDGRRVFIFSRPEIRNYKADANADLIPIPGQLELHGRCRCGVLVVCMLFVLCLFADLIVGMEELELHYRRRGRSNFQKIKIATISVRMVKLR